MAGFFDRCGAHTCPPHAMTPDKKTVISFENAFLKTKLENLFSIKKEEALFEQTESLEDFTKFFSNWIKTQKNTATGINKKFIVIKHPLTIFALEKIMPHLLNPSYIVLKRPLEDIENSRIRRGWREPAYGKEGASVIYEKINDVTKQLKLPIFEINYKDFCSSNDMKMKMLEFCNLYIEKKKFQDASDWVRR